MADTVAPIDQASEVSRSTNHDLDGEDFEGLERRKVLASRAYQQGVQFLSVDFKLHEVGLGQYIDDFIQSNDDMIEAYEFRTDEEVDSILRNVEKVCGTRFPYRHRCLIWKALRFDWFYSPETAKDFIDRSEVPILTLPKKDFRIRDNMIDVHSLDSDRQRMVRRRTILDEVEGTVVIQDEVFKRMPDSFYELEGLERTFQYWMTQDPRKMAREDPREEVLLNQLKEVELKIAARIDELKHARHVKRIVQRFFIFIKILLAIAAVFFLIISVIEARSASIPPFEAFSSQPYLRLSVLYTWTFWFVFETTRPKRPQTSADIDLARNMHAKCRLLNSDMISFRLKTHYVRQDRIPRFLDDVTARHDEDEAEFLPADDVPGESGAFATRLSRTAKPNYGATEASLPREEESVPPVRRDAPSVMPLYPSVTTLSGRSQKLQPHGSHMYPSIRTLLESDDSHLNRETVIKSLLQDSAHTVPEIPSRRSSTGSERPTLIRMNSSSSSSDPESPHSRIRTRRVDTFHLAQGETFQDQQRDEILRLNSLIEGLSADADPSEDSEADDVPIATDIFQMGKSFGHN